MSVLSPLTPIVDRGLSLHKMIRFVTLLLGGEGYLNFMGNEFGHPEWIDFPREGNSNSFKHCCRKWHLCDDELLRYKFLNSWDVAMHKLDAERGFLRTQESYVSLTHESDKVVVVEKGGVVCVFNFHPTTSFSDYKIGAPLPGW